MANTKSSKKDLKRSAKAHAVNTSVKSALKTQVKKVKVAAKAGEATTELLVGAVSALDKAVQRGIIHKNQAARRKSRIAKAAHKASVAVKAQEVAGEAPKKVVKAKVAATPKGSIKPKAAPKKAKASSEG
jgi:small subunit ribosomal protein S20